MAGWNRMRALATALACVASAHQSAEAQVRGTATFRERVKLPADAVFEATLEDATRAGAPGSVLGRTHIAAPRSLPIRFVIDYDASRIEPRHVYVVKARVIVGSRQRFVADPGDRVLTWGHGRHASLLLRRSNAPVTPEPGDVASSDSANRDSASPHSASPDSASRDIARHDRARSEVSHGDVARDEVPGGGAVSSGGEAIFSGNLPCADCTAVRHQLELFPNGSYFLRRRFLGKGRDAYVDEIGRWTLSRDGSMLTLKGTGDTALRLAIGKRDTLQVLGASGKKTQPTRRNTLTLTNRARPLEPRLVMRGLFTYMADAGRFTECSTHQSWPVAQEGDNAALESAYSRARRRDAEGTLVRVVGRVAMRPRVEGRGSERTLVVERFLDLRPGEGCTGGAVATGRGGASRSGTTNATLENTYWRLISLSERPVTLEPGQQEPSLTLNAGTGRMSGWSGCSVMSGRYRTKGQRLAFTTLMSMRTACESGKSGTELERRYLAALRKVSRAKITRRRLELLDARGKVLARFDAGRSND